MTSTYYRPNGEWDNTKTKKELHEEFYEDLCAQYSLWLIWDRKGFNDPTYRHKMLRDLKLYEREALIVEEYIKYNKIQSVIENSKFMDELHEWFHCNKHEIKNEYLRKLFWQAISRDYHAIITPSYYDIKFGPKHQKHMKKIQCKLTNLYDELKKQGFFIEEKWLPLKDIMEYKPCIVTEYSN